MSQELEVSKGFGVLRMLGYITLISLVITAGRYIVKFFSPDVDLDGEQGA